MFGLVRNNSIFKMLESLNVLLTINYNIAVLGKWGRERSCKRDKIIIHPPREVNRLHLKLLNPRKSRICLHI